MGLFIKDEAVDHMATEVQALMGVKTKTEAVRSALADKLAALKPKRDIKAALESAWALAEAMGPSDTDLDMKAFMDELSGEDVS